MLLCRVGNDIGGQRRGDAQPKVLAQSDEEREMRLSQALNRQKEKVWDGRAKLFGNLAHQSFVTLP